MTIILIGLFIGLICGLAGAKRVGFVSGWTTLLNASVSMYLAIYIAPIVVDSVSIVARYTYGPVICTFVLAAVLFAILGRICSTVTGDLKIAMPKVIETLGGGAIGFINGMLLWGFLCLLLEISPAADSSIVKDTCRDPAEISRMWKASVGTSVAVLSTISCQGNAEPLGDKVEAMKAVSQRKERSKPLPTTTEDSATPEGDANSVPASGG
jgi:hypothetical protein